MPVRTANAQWEGGFKRGSGNVALGSGAFEGPYSARDRFEDGTNTNPEELIGAAHSACFSMAFSNILAKAGTPPVRVDVEVAISADKLEAGFTVTNAEIVVRGRAPGATQDTFAAAAEQAKDGCPISRALKGNVAMTVQATLEGEGDTT